MFKETRYPGYRVSDEGVVFGPLGRALKPARQKTTGYLKVHISMGRRGNSKTEYVHTLVLEAFVGPCPPGKQACHRDGNPENNEVTNLYWGTAKQNSHDKFKHGTVYQARLTESRVRIARALHREGSAASTKFLARAWGVSYHTLRDAVAGRTWKHV